MHLLSDHCVCSLLLSGLCVLQKALIMWSRRSFHLPGSVSSSKDLISLSQCSQFSHELKFEHSLLVGVNLFEKTELVEWFFIQSVCYCESWAIGKRFSVLPAVEVVYQHKHLSVLFGCFHYQPNQVDGHFLARLSLRTISVFLNASFPFGLTALHSSQLKTTFITTKSIRVQKEVNCSLLRLPWTAEWVREWVSQVTLPFKQKGRHPTKARLSWEA